MFSGLMSYSSFISTNQLLDGWSSWNEGDADPASSSSQSPSTLLQWTVPHSWYSCPRSHNGSTPSRSTPHIANESSPTTRHPCGSCYSTSQCNLTGIPSTDSLHSHWLFHPSPSSLPLWQHAGFAFCRVQDALYRILYLMNPHSSPYPAPITLFIS